MKKDTYDSIPDRIKAERKRLSLTQIEAAEKCEVTRVQWGRYERGESEFGGRVLKAFIDEYDTQLPRTTLRYAIEYFDEGQRQFHLKRKKVC